MALVFYIPSTSMSSKNNGNFRVFKYYLVVYIDVFAFKIVHIRYNAYASALLPIEETLLKLDLNL